MPQAARMSKPSARRTKPARVANDGAGAPVLGPEELFNLITAPKPAAAAPPGRVPIKPGVELEDIGGGNWYVVVNGKPVARYENREGAEQLARSW
jgi:hypothetical protein